MTEKEPNIEDVKKDTKKYFTERIAVARVRASEHEYLMKNTSRSTMPSMRNIFAIGVIMEEHYAEIMELLNGVMDAVFSLNDEFEKKSSELEKAIECISEKTGVDLSSLKTDVDAIKETVGPRISAVIQLFADLKKNEEKRKANEGKSIV